jgi:hypothetical protein
MEALSFTHWCVKIPILWFDWGGDECEIWDTIDTCAWLIWAFTQVLWPMNANYAILIRPWYFQCYIASFVICLRWCCSIFVVFIMNDSWLDVLDLLRSSAAGGLFGTSKSACWGIQSRGLTPLSHFHVAHSITMFWIHGPMHCLYSRTLRQHCYTAPLKSLKTCLQNHTLRNNPNAAKCIEINGTRRCC